jgi:hypothetical protein
MVVTNGRETIGEITDHGPGKVLAIQITPTGKRMSLGYHPTRRAAMAAISAARLDGGEPPPQAA